MKSSPVVLLAQDTTEYDENICLGPKGLGTLKEVTKRARRLHPTIAFTPSRICLGVVKAAYWARDGASPRHERRRKGVDEKESRHWLESYQDSCALQAQMPDNLLVNLADREGDIYEWFVEYQDYAPTVRAEWIVRAAQNRCLQGATDEAAKCLWSALAQAPALGLHRSERQVATEPRRTAGAYHATHRHDDPQVAGACWVATCRH